MTARWAGRGIACVVMAGLVAGCMRPAGPSGLVRSGQTGRYVSVEAARPGHGYEIPPIELPPRLLLDEFVGERGYPTVATGYISPVRFVHTPIVVTENAADEEFWEFIYRMPPGTTRAGEPVERPFLVLGARTECEAMRDLHERNNVRTGLCIGPHYFKRTGPPRPPVPLKSTG
jgi:hypothetical protein